MGGNCWLPLSKDWALFFSIFKMCINSLELISIYLILLTSRSSQIHFKLNFLRTSCSILCHTLPSFSHIHPHLPTQPPLSVVSSKAEEQKVIISLYLSYYSRNSGWTSRIFGEYPLSDISIFRVFLFSTPVKFPLEMHISSSDHFAMPEKNIYHDIFWYISTIKYTELTLVTACLVLCWGFFMLNKRRNKLHYQEQHLLTSTGRLIYYLRIHVHNDQVK